MDKGLPKGLFSEAGRVVEASIAELPVQLRELALGIPVMLFEKIPSHLIEEGWEPDLLGLFDGGEDGARSGSARISLFLENILAHAGGDREVFRDEVRITFLHELGHLLDLEEDDLDARGLG